MSGVTFERKVNLGQILAAIALVISIATSYAGLSARLAVIESKVNDMWEVFLSHRPAPR